MAQSTEALLYTLLLPVHIIFQVTTAAVEQYGEGEPPYCEIMLRATDNDKSALTILQPVTLIGVRQQNNINIFQIERVLVDTDGIPLYTPQPSPMSKG